MNTKLLLMTSLTCVMSTGLQAADLAVTINSQSGKVVADIVVYLEPLTGQPLAKTDKQLVITQSKKSFVPYLSVTQVGNPMTFSNRDDITHHIYSADSKEQFAFVIKPGEQVERMGAKAASEIAMGCNVHDWMSGHLLVLETPYFGKTNAAGQVSFSTALAGKYALTVWHPQLKTDDQRQRIVVDLDTEQAVTLTLVQPLATIPEQKSDDDFDFLSDY